MDYLFAVLLQVVLIGLNAVFACAEIAVISMNESKLNLMLTKGGKDAKTAKKLSKLTADPARFLSTIQVAITLAGFLGSAFAADMFAEPLVGFILSTGVPILEAVVFPVCVVLITIILAFFNIVFGELIPKRVAMNKAEGVAKGLAGVLSVVSVVFRPVVALLTVSTNGVLRLFGINPEDKGDEVTEEDILMMAQVSSESGNIEGEENQLIKNIFQFSDLTVGEICTHRKDIDALYLNDGIEEWKHTINSTAHSYYPVCGESSDDVKGILFAKLYFRLPEQDKKHALEKAVLPPVFFYENTPANKVFERMKETHEYFGVVVDEYGGVTGIVTIHDLLETLVGDMSDKGEKEEYTIDKPEDGTWVICGIAPFYKVEEALGLELKTEDDAEYETFNGYLLSLLDEIPADGSTPTLSTEQLDVKVLQVEKRCITKVTVRLKA